MKLSTEAKVGLFVLIGAISFALTILIFGEIPFFKQKTKKYSVLFTDVAGLSEGAEVRVAGIKTGRVTGFRIEEGKVRVFFEIREDIPVYKNATASIGTLGFMGDKYLAIYPGTPDAGILEENSEIRRVTKISDMDYLIRELTITSRNISELTRDLAEIIRENKESINRIIENLENTLETTKKLTENINRLIVLNEKHINETAENINVLTASLKESLPELLEEMKEISQELEAILKENRTNIAEFTEDLKEISEKINKIVTKIEKGEGFLGKIIHDEKMYEDIQSGVSLFSEMGQTVTKTVLYIGMRGEVYKNWDGKGIFTVRVQPDDKKYYLVEIVGDSRGRVYVEELSNNEFIVRKQFAPEITLQYARIFGTDLGKFVVRGGLKESTGGFGFDYVLSGRIKLFSDVWDFGRRNPSTGGEMSPNLQIGIRARVKGSFYLTVGGDELLNNYFRGAFVGAGLMFTDQDLKYMMGSLSLPLP